MDVKDEYKDFIEEVNDKLKSPIYFYEEEFTDNYDSLSYISKQDEGLQLEMELKIIIIRTKINLDIKRKIERIIYIPKPNLVIIL